MQGTVFFGVRRAYLAEILPGTVTPSQYGFSDDDPRVVVAEDTRIFLDVYKRQYHYIVLSLSASESAAWPDAVYSGAAERPDVYKRQGLSNPSPRRLILETVVVNTLQVSLLK